MNCAHTDQVTAKHPLVFDIVWIDTNHLQPQLASLVLVQSCLASIPKLPNYLPQTLEQAHAHHLLPTKILTVLSQWSVATSQSRKTWHGKVAWKSGMEKWHMMGGCGWEWQWAMAWKEQLWHVSVEKNWQLVMA